MKVQSIKEEQKVDSNQEYVEFKVDLEKGEVNLQTWFTLDTEETLGAYFVSIEKVE